MEFRKAKVLVNGLLAGFISETEDGYIFSYVDEYLADRKNPSVSLTLPREQKEYKSPTLFPFFDGLIPEGWLLDVTISTWKINERDRMGLLLASCKDCIGNVSVEPMGESDE